MTSTMVRFAAVGDLLLAPGPAPKPYPRDPRLVSRQLRHLLAGCDVVLANLECTLAGDGGCVPTEPRVVATEPLVRAVKEAGFGVVTLANNHMFDCFDSGFRSLRGLLDEIGLVHFGAGMDMQEAAAPAVLEAGGLRIALVGAVDERSGPSHFAARDQWGVAPFDVERLVGQVRDLRADADHVIVSVHWGEERFLIPSPTQIDQARRLVDAGASMVLGHHPHVLQGIEIHNGSPIVYSLGNFIADEVHFSDGGAVRWNRVGRTGCILLADLTSSGVSNVRQVPTYDSGDAVELDHSRFGTRRLARTRRALQRGVTVRRYRREHLWVKTIKPILSRLHPRRLLGLRLRHVRKALEHLRKARDVE